MYQDIKTPVKLKAHDEVVTVKKGWLSPIGTGTLWAYLIVGPDGLIDVREAENNERKPFPKNVGDIAFKWLDTDEGQAELKKARLDAGAAADAYAMTKAAMEKAAEAAKWAGSAPVDDVMINQPDLAPKDAQEDKDGSGSEPALETPKPRARQKKDKAKAPDPDPSARPEEPAGDQDNPSDGDVASDQPKGDQPAHKPRKKAPGETATVGSVPKLITTMASLNERYAILQVKGSPSAYIHRPDFLPIRAEDLRMRLAGEVVQTNGKDGAANYVDAAKYWTGNAHRHVYRKVAFTNGPISDDTYNLFPGLGVTPRKGECGLIVQHIEEVICAGVKINSEAMLDLQAWQIQNIGEPSRVVVVMHNPNQQVGGKGLIFEKVMVKIYGQAGFAPSDTDQILGRFNETIRGRVFIFMDEILFSGDLKVANQIKSLSTATYRATEAKGLPIIQFPVAVNFWLASNHENAVHIEPGDARYWILRVSEHRADDAAYWAALAKEIKNGGAEAFAYFLQHRDVSGFEPKRDIPRDNAERRQMIRQSLNPYDARVWLEECATAEQFLGSEHSWTTGEVVLLEFFIRAYTKWQQDIKTRVAPKPTPVGSLAEVLGKAGFGGKRDKLARRRAVPSPAECLRALEDLGKGR